MMLGNKRNAPEKCTPTLHLLQFVQDLPWEESISVCNEMLYREGQTLEDPKENKFILLINQGCQHVQLSEFEEPWNQ